MHASLPLAHESKIFIIKILLIYVLSLFFATLFGPWVMDLVGIWHLEDPSKLTTYLMRKPLGVYMDRLRLIFCLLGLVFLYRKHKCIFKAPFAFASWDSFSLKTFLGYFALGLGMVGVIGATQVFSGSTTLKPLEMNILYSITLKALCAGLLAAFLEEYLFRGLLFRSFSAFCRWPWAIGFSSLIFAWLHFRAPVDPSIPEPFWVLFWRLLIGPFNQPLELPFQLPFLNLLLLGSFLSFIYHYRYRLIVPIAFHWSVASACLAFKKISFTIFDNFVIGSNRITDGLLTTALLLGLNLWGYLKIKKTSAS